MKIFLFCLPFMLLTGLFFVNSATAQEVPAPDQTLSVLRLNRPAFGNTSMLQFGLADVLLENVSEFNGAGLLIRNWYNNAYLTSFKITANGKVGVGTASPRGLLDVAKYAADQTLGTVLARQQEGDQVGDGTYLGVRGYGTQVADYGGKSFSLEHGFRSHQFQTSPIVILK